MDETIPNKRMNVFGKKRWLTGAGFLAVIAIAIVLAVSSGALAKGTEQQQTLHSDDGGKIMLAANDAHAADTAKKDAETAKPAKESHGFLGFILNYLGQNPFAFLFIALAMGYPLGRVKVKGISLGSTAGTLVVGIIIALAASALFGIKYEIPGLVQDIFLMLFMYALGMRVGPQFFSGLARGGLDFVIIGLLVAFTNFVVVFFGVKLVGMEPGYAAGIISGSYTITAVMGVAQSAITSGAFKIPQGLTADVVGANMAAGYAISYVISSIFIILLIKYLPSMFGKDPVQAAKEAEASFGGEDASALPGTAGASLLGFTDRQIRSRSWRANRFRICFTRTRTPLYSRWCGATRSSIPRTIPPCRWAMSLAWQGDMEA